MLTKNIKDIWTESWAVCLRDLNKSTKLWKQIIITIVTLLFVVFIGTSLDKIIEMPSGYLKFFAPGFITYLISIVALGIGTDLVIDRSGFMKLLLIAPISRISIMIGKLLYVLISIGKSYLIIIIALLFYFKTFSVFRLILVFITIMLIILLFLGLGFFIAAFIKNKKTADKVFQFISALFLFFSGIFYPINPLPTYIKFLSYFNPMTYAVEAMRFSVGGMKTLSFSTTYIFLLTFTALTTVIGLYFYDRFQRI